MKCTQKKTIMTAALLALLTTSAGCAVYDDHDHYRYGRYDRSSRLDLDRDGRVEQWERNRVDRDRDGRIERWERERASYPYYYGRDNWRYDRHSDSQIRDRFDR